MSTVPAAHPQLSIHLRTFSDEETPAWQVLFDQVAAADAAGVDRVVVSDHVVFGTDLDAYGDPAVGGVAGGRQPTGPDGHWLEPLTLLSNLAARTESVRLATGILLAALRRPVVLAKMAATVDVLSGGRLDLGVGVGWQRAEYDAAGIAFGERGRRLDDTLAICDAFWRNVGASHDSEFLTFDDLHMRPKPVGGTVPVWVSGTVNPRSMRRLARFGVGWIPWGDDAADPAASIPRMRAAVAEHDRDPSDLGVVGTMPVVSGAEGSPDVDASIAAAEDLVAAGVTDLKLRLPVPADRDAAVDMLGPWVAGVRALR